MNVSIIIVNYNTKDLLANCISSIYEFTSSINFEIIIVDNASTDGSQKYVKSNFPHVILIESDENLGFGKANNLGTQYAKGEFLFFLNSDTLLIENSISKLFSFFVENESKLNIGVLGTILVDENLEINGYGNSFPTCKKETRKNLYRIPFLRAFVSNPTVKTYDLHNEYFEIDYVIGADMFLRKTIFEKTEGFYKNFFMYYEESDLQKRIQNLGFRQYIFTKTKIVHLEEGSGKVIKNYSNKKRIITHQSKVIYLKRNDHKDFHKYVFFDFLFLVSNFFNFKYTLRENFKYFKDIIRIY